MATRIVVCPECDEPVSYGRLSCASCGSLLASVAGAPRRSAPLQAMEVVEPPTLVPDEELSPAELARGPMAVADADEALAEPDAAAGAAWSEAVDAWAATPLVEPYAADADDEAPAAADDEALAVTDDEAPSAVDDDAPATDEASDAEAPAVEDQVPASGGWAATVGDAAAVGQAAPAPVPPVLQDWTPPAPPPGDDEPLTHPWAGAIAADAPPVLYPSAARAVGVSDPRPPAPAGAWLPPAAPAPTAVAAPGTWPVSMAATPAPGAGAATVAAAPNGAAAARPLRPGEAPLLADLPFDAPDDLPGWLVAIGSVVAMAGFILPWSDFVIGAASTGGYTDTWGLAAPPHLLVLAAAAITFALSILPNRVPAWLRSGVLPLAHGGLLVGLAWPYLLILRDGGLGVMAVAVAGGLLIVGGVLASRPRRHGGAQPGV